MGLSLLGIGPVGAPAPPPGLTTIIEEVGGSDSSVLRGSAPNTTNTPGNSWLSASDNASAIRTNGRIDINQNNDRNYIDTGETDVEVTAICNVNSVSSPIFSIVARHDGSTANNTFEGFAIRWAPDSATTAQLIRVDGSLIASGTVLASTTDDFTGDVTLKLTCIGDQITAHITDGTTTWAPAPVTDTGHAAQTFAAFVGNITGQYLESFKVAA